MAAASRKVEMKVGDKVRPHHDIQFFVPIKGATAGPRFREDWLRCTYEYRVYFVSRDGTQILLNERKLGEQHFWYASDFEVVVEKPQPVLQLV